MDQPVNILLTSNEFGFTSFEMDFVRKHLQKKYPQVMGNFVMCARQLMRWVQNHASKPLTYGAYRYTIEETQRYHVSEQLTQLSEAGERFYIAVQPYEEDKRELLNRRKFQGMSGGVGLVIETLKGWAEEQPELLQCTTTCGIAFSDLVPVLLQFLGDLQTDGVVHQVEWSNDERPSLSLDIGHAGTRSHYLRLVIDWVQPPAAV